MRRREGFDVRRRRTAIDVEATLPLLARGEQGSLGALDRLACTGS